jgi:PST family polysaccharide transporter
MRRVLAFGLVPAMSMFGVLLIVPLVARLHGESGVVAVSVGQSVGAMLSIVVSLSWPLTGPAAIARADRNERVALYRASINTRLPIFVACVPIGVLVLAVLLPAQVAAGALCAVAFTALGFTSSWYYAGLGKPRGLLVFEAIPRMLATIAAGAALFAGAPLLVYPLALLVATLTGLLLINRDATDSLAWLPGRADLAELRGQLRPTMSRLANSAYLYGTTPLIAWLAPHAVFVFASYDRVRQSATHAANSFPQAFVHTVASQYPPRYRVQSMVLALDAVLALAAGIGLYLILPPALSLLYGPIAVIDDQYCLLLGMAFGLMLMYRCLMWHGLLPLKDHRSAVDILGGASLFGLAGVGILTAVWDIAGAFWGLAVTNGAIVLVLGLRFVIVRRRVYRS